MTTLPADLEDAVREAMQAAQEHQSHFGKSIVDDHFLVSHREGGVYEDHVMAECPHLRAAIRTLAVRCAAAEARLRQEDECETCHMNRLVRESDAIAAVRAEGEGK